MTAWIIAISILLLAAGLLALALRRRRVGRAHAAGEAWTRQDRLAVASLLSGAVLGALGLILPLVVSDDGQDNPPPGDDGQLELVDTSVVDPSARDAGPGIDLKFRNTGSDVSFLTDLTLTIKYSDELVICEAGAHEVSSYTYAVQLPLDPEIGQEVSTDISQKIPPNQTDRFIARVSPEPFIEHPLGLGQPVGFKVYIATVEILHDGGDSLDGGDVVLLVPVKRQYAGPGREDYSDYLLDPPDPSSPASPCYEHNRDVLNELAAAPDAAVSPLVTATVE